MSATVISKESTVEGRDLNCAPCEIPPKQPTVTVIIACYDSQRFNLLNMAVNSVCAQDYPHQLTVVVDNNEALYSRLRDALPPAVSLIRNNRTPGASGARNSGALVSETDLIAFLDDDAMARAGWLGALVHEVVQPGVIGAGGTLLPRWQESRPRWFPSELDWVIGTSIYKGAQKTFPVRNVWSGSMMIDGSAFKKVGGFSETLGKVGARSQPEDTELCLRISRVYGKDATWLMVPTAPAEHHVPVRRATLRYVVNRCWSEGAGKVLMRALSADQKDTLTVEKAYLLKTIPRAVVDGVRESLKLREPYGLLQAATIVLGIGAALAGAAITEIRMWPTRKKHGSN